MPTLSSTKIDTAFIEELLKLSAPSRQVAFLQKHNLLNQESLLQLLDAATGLARSDPGRANQLTDIAIGAARQADALLIVPKANYIRAQVHAINGQLSEALELIETVRDGYHELGEETKALRTNVGLMHVLNELGRHQEAIEVGQTTLKRLNQVAHSPEVRLIVALVHHNQGICYRLMGRYREALTAYAAAETHYSALDMTEHLGDIHHNRGIVLLHLGRAREALAAFETASTILGQAERTLLQAQSLINMGDAHLLLGNYTRSLDALAQAHRLLDSIDALAQEQVLLLQRAEVYLALNLYPEAMAAYQEAEGKCQEAGMSHYRARALWGMGAVKAAQFQFEEAETALAQAAHLFATAENIPMLCSVKLEHAALQAAGGEEEMALATAREALALVADHQWPVQQLYAHLRLFDLLLSRNREAAEKHLLAAQRRSRELELPHLRYRLYQRLGSLRQQQGRDEEARTWLEMAVGQIERLRGTVAQEAMRVSFLHDKMAAYEELLRLYLDQSFYESSVRRAFAIAEQAKSRTLLDLLTGVIDTKQILSPDSELAGRLQTLQAELNAVYNQLLSNAGEQAGETTQSELRARAKVLENETNQLRLRATVRAPEGGLFSKALSLHAIRARLPSDLILLAYHIIGDEIIAFVSRGQHVCVRRQVSTATAVQELLQRLSVQWQRFRAGETFVKRHMSRLQRSTQRILAALYVELIAPLVPDLVEYGEEYDAAKPVPLAIIPHGLLHQIPFHALFDGERYLLDRFEISYAPSATVLALRQKEPQRAAAKALVLGVSDPSIPAVRAEVKAVSQQWPQATVCLDEKATTAAVRDSGGFDVLHLACHGLFRADNPLFSALKLHDGWLTAADVLQLDLNEALVTLSACESGRGQVLKGDEVIGLSRAFLGAGATTLAVTLWLVQDETTAKLMECWYKQLQSDSNVSRAAALRTAQLALKTSHPHPYYWAPFILVGQR